MGAPAYLFNDYVKGLAAAAISITSEDSTNYPETNLQNEQGALCTRTTAKIDVKFRFDLGSAIALQMFFVGNHNFSGGSFAVNSYSADDYTTDKATVATVTVRAHDVFSRAAAAPTARRYWEFDFSVCTSADSFFEIGRIMAYTDYVLLSDTEDVRQGRAYRNRNLINETLFGCRWIHKLAAAQEVFDLGWSTRVAANIETELRALHDAVSGSAHPFVFIPRTGTTDVYYGYKNKDSMDWTLNNFPTPVMGQVTLGFIEAVRGKV